MKRAYYFLFYKFYQFWESVSGDSWSDFKALVMVGGLEAMVALELVTLWSVFTKSILDFNKVWLVGVALAIGIINYLIFLHKNKWKEIVSEFDLLPKRTNQIGSMIVLGIVLFVIGNLFFSFYLMSQIDWSQYR